MDEMLAEAKSRDVQRIKLESKITARNSYAGFDFKDDGTLSKIPIGGISTTAFPMQLELLQTEESW